MLELTLDYPNYKLTMKFLIARGGEVKRIAFFLFSILCASEVSSHRAPGLEFAVRQSVPLSVQGSSLQDSIQDRDERAAFLSTLNESNPAKKATMLESFIGKYPDSVAAPEAFEQAIGLWQNS